MWRTCRRQADNWIAPPESRKRLSFPFSVRVGNVGDRFVVCCALTLYILGDLDFCCASARLVASKRLVCPSSRGYVSGRRYADRMATEFTVRGSFGKSQPPERATVHASISYEGPSMEPVYTRVARDLDVVQKSVTELKDKNDAPITWWSAAQLSTWSSRPWNQEGKQLPLVHHAGVSIEVKFRDFSALSSWVGEQIINVEGFRVTSIRWALTAKRRDELIREARERAVHDAVERAQQYADAVGLGRVRPVAIADSGMLQANLWPDGAHGEALTAMRAESGPVGGGSRVGLVPQDIEIAASVDARFVVERSDVSAFNHSSGAEESRELERKSAHDHESDVGVGEFRDDDPGYLAWLNLHRDGYVLNIARSYSTSGARVHRADCWTISGEHSHGNTLTGPYVKLCAQQLSELDQWATNEVGAPVARCGTCHPENAAVQYDSGPRATAALVSEARHDIRGPAADDGVVEAWADDYIRFERLPDWQRQLRNEIRSRCRQLEPSAEQVLHATFFGAKHPKADVENVLLYYIDSFKVAGSQGIRFEHGSGVLPGPNADEFAFGYRYALAPRSGTFTHWRQGRTLAAFDWTNLESFKSDNQLAPVWLALRRGETKVYERAASDAPFAVRVEIRPPYRRQPVWGGLLKGVFDGVTCAYQAHTDTAVLSEAAARLAALLPADSLEIEEHLLDQRRAVLGVVHRLVSPYRGGVKWDPSDHLCVAGDLLAAEPVDDRWAIRGEIFEVFR